ncbi:MAG: sigma-54-dependent Fis family transcriptional regulator [Planctomycetes bacterium]|nr:sigma-54-dependent Fis family transcriptional regulator [Planctomycetota bacterium]
MRRSVVIFSSDDQLTSILSSYCKRILGGELSVCSDFISARSAFRRHGVTTLFIDLRPEAITDETAQLFHQLNEDPQNVVELIPLCDGSYPREFAEYVDLHSLSHLDTPLDEEAACRTLQSLARRNGSNGACRKPRQYVVRSDKILFTTYSPAMIEMFEQLLRVAKRDVTLLLVGETGTGKSTLAKLIHQLTNRRDRPFHIVACGALPRDLIESELFGHVRGAFTGADRNKIGRFEAAGRGTLLLDEIDILGPNEQAKLLRVIETSEYEMVGSTETRISKARLIVASNVDLQSLMEDSEFRSDLYYRLNVLEFCLPPLRERLLDIVPLAVMFINECCKTHGIEIRRVHRDFLEALKKYRWPGNVRELKNQVQRSVLFCKGCDLAVDDLSAVILKARDEEDGNGELQSNPSSLAHRVASNEQQILKEVLHLNGQNRVATAQALGISRVGLYKKMRKYGLIEKKA